MPSYPAPVGPGTSFADLAPQSRSSTFSIAAGDRYVVTFNPVDPENPGVATLYNSSDVSVLDMTQGGSYGFSTPAGSSFYFKATRGARNVSVVEPTLFY